MIHPFQPPPPDAHGDDVPHAVHPVLCHTHGSPQYCVIVHTLCGELRNAVMRVIDNTVLYSAHLTADHPTPGVHAVYHPPAHHCAHDCAPVHVTAYEGFIHAPFAQFAELPHTVPTSPIGQPKFGQHVPVARAADAAPGVFPEAFPPLFPLRIIFAVPESVRVPAT